MKLTEKLKLKLLSVIKSVRMALMNFDEIYENQEN